MKCLLIEDDLETADYIRTGLAREGHQLDHATDGLAGLELGRRPGYDVLIIDRMLPGLDGLSLVKQLRGQGHETPVLFLTSAGGIEDRVEGFDAGGDDYLLKPFAFAELVARLGALARRPPKQIEQTILRVGDLQMNLLTRKVTRAGSEIDLQPREFKLLEYLMRNPGRILTRSMLLERVWDFHFDPRTNVVETHISRLRAKVDKPFDAEMILTMRGAGYCLDLPSRSAG